MLIPKNVNFIIEKLNEAGFCAYAVGGCVRDAFLGKIPNDWDITTSALPHETKNVFQEFPLFDTGIKYGTVTLILSGIPYEITTYRSEKNYTDFRHPSEVTFSDDICEDLSRRDFTVNAMAYSPFYGLKDPFGGIDDINKKLIRAVRNPSERFTEDPLRILRGIRFAISTRFSVEKETGCAIKSHAQLLSHISSERIKAEFDKIFSSDNPLKPIFTQFQSVIFTVFPDLSDSDFETVYTHIDACVNDTSVKWALFFQNIPIEKAQSAMKQLRFSNAEYKSVTNILTASEALISSDKIRLLLSQYGKEPLAQIINFQYARGQISDKDLIFSEIENIITSGKCYSLSTLAIKGSDISHIYKGNKIGLILKALLQKVINDELENEKSVLLDYVSKNFIPG